MARESEKHVCTKCNKTLEEVGFYSYVTAKGARKLRSRCKDCYNLPSVHTTQVGGQKYTLCNMCKKEFPKKSKSHKFCSPECKGKYKYTSNIVTTETQYSRISGDPRRYLLRILQAHNRKSDGLTIEELMQLLEDQNGLCSLSGVELTFNLIKGSISKTNASIDRINPGKPYTKDNIQLVCRAVNSFRADLSVIEYINWCKLVAEYNK